MYNSGVLCYNKLLLKLPKKRSVEFSLSSATVQAIILLGTKSRDLEF